MSNIAENKLYTYADYLTYPENERVEIIYGHIYAMSPSPSRIHQKIIMELSTVIKASLYPVEMIKQINFTEVIYEYDIWDNLYKKTARIIYFARLTTLCYLNSM